MDISSISMTEVRNESIALFPADDVFMQSNLNTNDPSVFVADHWGVKEQMRLEKICTHCGTKWCIGFTLLAQIFNKVISKSCGNAVTEP